MDHSAVAATMCASLVDEWVALGVNVAMVAPGSRSTPMALALAAHPAMSVHVFIDERAASFAALGAARFMRRPAIVLCTSGTAATEFHSAVVEAHHSDVPLLVLTADRPPELQGVGAPQTINQTNLYGAAVRRFVDVGVADAADRDAWRRTARDIVASAIGDHPGPVHVNLPFREPLLGAVVDLPPRADGSVDAVDEIRRIGESRSVLDEAMISNIVKDIVALLCENGGEARRGVIIAGNCQTDPDVLDLAVAMGWPVWADPRSGVRVEHPCVVSAVDALLRDDRVAEQLQPDVVLRFGSMPASKVVATRLREWGCVQVCVTPGPQLMDPDRIVTRHVVAGDTAVVRELVRRVSAVDARWLQTWQSASQGADRTIAGILDSGSLTEPAIARVVARESAARGTLFVSSSMPIRDVEWYAAPQDGLVVMANRGANGIDGVIASATGASLVSDTPMTLLIGDVAFLHDSSALVGLANRGCDLRIVLVDNDGGGIFSFLPQARDLDEQTFELLFGTPSRVDIEFLARAHGLRYVPVATRDDLVAALATVGPSIVHVRTDRRRVVADHDAVNDAVAATARSVLGIG